MRPASVVGRAASEEMTLNDDTSQQHDEDALKDAGTHVLHGVEDVADVLAHGLGGAVEGLADGVESASTQTELRKETDAQSKS